MSRSRFTGLISLSTCQHLPFLWYSYILQKGGLFYCSCVKAYAHNSRHYAFCQQYISRFYAFLLSSKCFAYCIRSSVKHGGERHTGNLFCSGEPENIRNRMDAKEKAQPPYSGDCATNIWFDCIGDTVVMRFQKAPAQWRCIYAHFSDLPSGSVFFRLSISSVSRLSQRYYLLRPSLTSQAIVISFNISQSSYYFSLHILLF